MLGHTLERYAGAIDPQAAKRSRTTDRARRYSGQRDRPTDGRISKRPGQSWTVPARGGKGATEFGDFFCSLLSFSRALKSHPSPFHSGCVSWGRFSSWLACIPLNQKTWSFSTLCWSSPHLLKFFPQFFIVCRYDGQLAGRMSLANR